MLGIDLSNNMVNIALERAASEADIKDKVGCHIYGSSTLLWTLFRLDEPMIGRADWYTVSDWSALSVLFMLVILASHSKSIVWEYFKIDEKCKSKAECLDSKSSGVCTILLWSRWKALKEFHNNQSEKSSAVITSLLLLASWVKHYKTSGKPIILELLIIKSADRWWVYICSLSLQQSDIKFY